MRKGPDLLIRGGRILDPANGVDAIGDVSVVDGRVAGVDVGGETPDQAVLDATGLLVIPGLVDLQVHVSSQDNGQVGHRMLARAGVTTALDLIGEIGDVLRLAGSHGAGLTLACVDGLDPERHFGGNRRPSRASIRDAIASACRQGAIGVKVHVEHGLSAEVASIVVQEANDLGVWVALHCGSPATGSNIEGLRETVEFLGDLHAHIAHVNSYCRGECDEPMVEALAAIELLRTVPQVVSESYLSEMNGNSARLVDGEPSSRVQEWLTRGGFHPNSTGLISAIREGWAQIPVATEDGVELLSGDEGLSVWLEAETETGLSLPINPAISRIALAASKDSKGAFDVDALATDGGGIPRNVTIREGLALVDGGLLSLAELVVKASLVGARALGLESKGHLGEGASADIAIVDPVTRTVQTTIAGGLEVARKEEVRSGPSTVLTLAAGADAVRAAGCTPKVIDVSRSGFYQGIACSLT